jgi:hypothetical protein
MKPYENDLGAHLGAIWAHIWAPIWARFGRTFGRNLGAHLGAHFGRQFGPPIRSLKSGPVLACETRYEQFPHFSVKEMTSDFASCTCFVFKAK